jgi:hypothetical protein
LREGKGYSAVLLALIAGWHAPQPKYMQKNPGKEEG